ncbi:Co-chaperone Hsc20 [Rickenella mellea]|uniref:Co-chaperone Hsc20 n=1 Tax=Rickenella mellea TaxID=50990 RepID=A0A4Y7QMG8_9AGAM|nr:Co-chaperone Hsc20 [Rickenella mellea]
MFLRLSPRHGSRLLTRIYSAVAARRCPSCSAPLPTALPTCPSCSHIEPLPSTLSYHDIFGLPSVPNPFCVNTQTLKARFLQAQKICHPDAWSGKGKKEHDIAAAQSALLNKAYQTLLSPLQRANYILAQQGLSESETDRLGDTELIMEVMEAREELEEATSGEAVELARQRNRDRINRTQKILEKLIGERRWDDAKKAAVELKYWETIENAVKDLE